LCAINISPVGVGYNLCVRSNLSSNNAWPAETVVNTFTNVTRRPKLTCVCLDINTRAELSESKIKPLRPLLISLYIKRVCDENAPLRQPRLDNLLDPRTLHVA